MDFLSRLFETSDFSPAWDAGGGWTPFVLWVHLLADVLICLACAAIPSALAIMLIRRRDVPAPFVMSLFVAFVLTIGVTHLVNAISLRYPLYRLGALLRAVTGVVSLTTAVVLIRSLPNLLAMPSISRKNAELQAALTREHALTQQLSDARNQLERRSSEMAARIRRMSDAMGAAKGVASRWSVETGEFHWEIGFTEIARHLMLEPGLEVRSWGDLLGEDGWRALQQLAEKACRDNAAIDHDTQLAESLKPGIRIRIAAHPEPHVQGQPRTVSGLFRLLTR